ncbi:MAG: DNA repair protein RadA [Leptospirales bacterium]|nr:DNA repair protein RadA [Leptospirales bacterium]
MKQKRFFICSACGANFPKWAGRCPACNEWNAISEGTSLKSKNKSKDAAALLLSDVEFSENERILTGISEFDLVCGGGIVPGSVILMGGEPGIGKSTMALQVAGFVNTLYVSAEESINQIKARADRLCLDASKIKITTERIAENIIELIEEEKPELLIVDSIQTLVSGDLPSQAGSAAQVRECASLIATAAKRTLTSVILIGHITKDGAIAGPKLLEHLVDAVLYFEGDFSRDFRVLRAFKNRYGSVNEAGLFRMTNSGLSEVRDKNNVFLDNSGKSSPGSAVSAALQGSRMILFEVQSLVTFTTFSNPRRMADGFDMNRLIILSAVLEKHAALKLSSFDIFINISGGFRVSEPSADLAVAAAIASSLRGEAIPEGVGLIGEISLAGTLRPVPQCGRRAQEFKSSGFSKIICSKADAGEIRASGFTGDVIGVDTVEHALAAVFGM